MLLLNKPFQVLTQFSPKDDKRTLADVVHAPGFYPAGRLDYDSEGLLLLTNFGPLQARLADPKWKTSKTYLAQLEGIPSPESLDQLAGGVKLSDGMTLPAEVELIDEPEWMWPRDPPIRERRTIPTSWIRLTIREGRNRQVRRMTAAINHPTLRLVRWSVGPWTLQGLKPGESREVPEDELTQWLRDDSGSTRLMLNEPQRRRELQQRSRTKDRR